MVPCPKQLLSWSRRWALWRTGRGWHIESLTGSIAVPSARLAWRIWNHIQEAENAT